MCSSPLSSLSAKPYSSKNAIQFSNRCLSCFYFQSHLVVWFRKNSQMQWLNWRALPLAPHHHHQFWWEMWVLMNPNFTFSESSTCETSCLFVCLHCCLHDTWFKVFLFFLILMICWCSPETNWTSNTAKEVSVYSEHYCCCYSS